MPHWSSSTVAFALRDLLLERPAHERGNGKIGDGLGVTWPRAKMSQGRQFGSAPGAEGPSARAISTERQMGWPVEGSVTTSSALPRRVIDRLLRILPVETDAAEQIACVIADAASQIALQATEQPNALVPQIVLDWTAFDIAPGDKEPGARICRAGDRIGERRRRAEDLNQIAVGVESWDFADEIAGPANQRSLLIGQQRIVAIDRLGVPGVSRWTGLPSDRSFMYMTSA